MLPEKLTKQDLDFAADLDFSKILTNPILDIAARLWDEDRYAAFRVCYRSMRRIDDLVDDRRAEGGEITAAEVEQYSQIMQGWLTGVQRGEITDEFGREFLTTVEQFAIPLWPWERLVKAMSYDLCHNGFSSFRSFLRYAEGAAIAPASIFMHLCGLKFDGKHYLSPEYDIRLAARDLAIFSYLVHIVRDFEKDQRAGLNYFADHLLVEESLTRVDLVAIARGGAIGPDFRRLMARYQGLARFYRQRARAKINELSPGLKPRYRASLELIYALYNQIFQRIDPAGSQFTGPELNPPPEDVQALIEQTLKTFK